ncbi:hypothetical protein [Streptomyces sp. B21-083]|uniref:hypothetical protein n=1 Tax=Streptomyces sp. B21-083 TaxID=3039410 RepID=UPI002FEF31F3
MPAISVGSVEVDVVPNTQGIYNRLRGALVPAATRAGQDAGNAAGRAFGPAMTSSISNSIGQRIGQQIGQQIAARITASIRSSLSSGITQGGQQARPAATRQGEETGGAFARSLRAKLQEAFRSMPKLDVRLSDTGIDADLARLRARMEALSNKTVGIDIDAETARAQAADIEERLRRIGASHPNVTVRADTARAIAQLQALQAQIDELTADPTRIRIETDGGLGARLRAAVQQAEASLPNVNIGADTTPAQVEIARLRAQLSALRDARIGVDIDAGTALARITEIQTRLARLSSQDADVAVRVDAGAASAQLAAFQAQVNRLDGQTARVDVDTSAARSGMGLLVTSAIAFGPAIIPVLPVVAAGLGAIAAAGVAAAVGVGAIALVAVPAVRGISKALTAQKAAQDAATNATYQGGQAAGQGASKALQMAGAQQALASAQRNAARQIADAERGVSDAVRQAAQSNERAAGQVKSARQALADAYVQAAERMQQANAEVSRAERDLAQAQKSARQAQLDLVAARREAAQQLEDLNNRLTDSTLSQRDAEIALKEATIERDKVLKSATATELDKQKAILGYDQAVQRLKEQKAETKDLAAETAAANKAGVSGSATVKSAQEQLAAAQQDVTDKTTALADAQQNSTKTQIQNARSITDAQSKLADAQKNVAETQRQGAETIARAQERVTQAQQSGADSIASAQRQIEQASLSAAGGVDQAAIAQAKYRAELAKLTPSARGTYNAFLDLRTAFTAWSTSLQPAVMPIFTRALVGLKNSLPGLTPFVMAAADAIGGLQDRVSRGFKSPWWRQFKTELAGSVGPAITGLGISFGRIFKGMAGVIDAFLPHMGDISDSMQRITGRFADWGTSLKGSPEFENFLSYSAKHAPLLGDAFGKIGTALVDIGQALEPVSGPLLQLIGSLAQGVSSLATNVPELVIGLYGLFIATRLWAGVMLIANVAMKAFNLISLAGPWGWIVLAIAAVVLAVIYLYRRFSWFRDGVKAVWAAIQTAAMWAWNNVLKPVFTGIWTALQAVGRWASWLWTTILSPVFGFIATAAKILLTAVVVLAILPIIAAVKILGAIGMWLWEHALKPAFEAIGALAKWLWTDVFSPTFSLIGIKARSLWTNWIRPAWLLIQFGARAMWENYLRPVFQAIGEGFRTVGKWATWFYRSAIKPAWDGIVAAGKWAYEHGIKPIFDRFKDIVHSLKSSFDTAVAAIKIAWDRIKGIAKAPVQYVVDVVYNNGVRGVWNKVASAFGAPSLPRFKFADGGVMPGYTPGKDVHKFVSPTGGRLDLSGGEAIMRPEFTRGAGASFVGYFNRLAKSQGAQGVKAALAPVLGGNPSTPTDRSLRYADGGMVQRFADGGIFGWIGSAANKVAGAGSAVWNKIKDGADWLKDTLEASARAGVKNIVDPLLKSFPGMGTGFGKMIRKVPDRIINSLFGYGKDADKKGAGGVGGPRIQAALSWAKTQNGLPYQWGGNGNPSWDCSGLVSAAESVIRGQKPHRRWATGAFSGRTAPPGWVYHGNSPFRVGITNAGVGHTAGTLGKTNIESRGGDGVVIGPRARGYNDKLFPSWYGFQPGKYDSGGYLQPGLNLAYNGTGRPEPVFTTTQANALTSTASRGATAGPASFEGNLYLDTGEFLGVVRGEAEQVVHSNNQALVSVLNAT